MKNQNECYTTRICSKCSAYLYTMEYFGRLLQLLGKEKDAERHYYESLNEALPVQGRRELGLCWYPIVIKDTEITRGDYLSIEIERPTHQDIIHQFRFGMSVALFSNNDPATDRIDGVISHLSGNRMKITLRNDELPDWSKNGKLGVDIVFDKNSYEEMEKALKLAQSLLDKDKEARLVKILIGEKQPAFDDTHAEFAGKRLNFSQRDAVLKIITAKDLAIVHGPPGTGKTTTIVQAIRQLAKEGNGKILAVAPSNAAVDLLAEKLSDEGLQVVRAGNPARVSDKLMALTLDSKMAAHPSNKAIKKIKRQASEFRDMAHKYKRNFGKAERDQRKALFAEASRMSKEVEQIEQYIIDDLLSRADVITATLVGSNHFSLRSLKYNTVVIDEAGQAIEPACWIPMLKAQKVVLAGDHQQLPPVIKSQDAADHGLALTLLEKLVARFPEAVVLLKEQYRMNEIIMRFSSRIFYEDKLLANESVARRVLFPGDIPLAFIDTAGCGYEELRHGTAISNPEEARFLLKQLNSFCTLLREKCATESFPSIAVISPYKRQVEVLANELLEFPLLKELGGWISVNTIDSFQGQERDIVYISLTRSNADNTIGFLSEVRRMNVAMTRARKKLVVIGDGATLAQSDFYANFITYSQEQNAYHSAWEFYEL